MNAAGKHRKIRREGSSWFLRVAAVLLVMFALGYVPFHWYRRSGFAKFLDLRVELAQLQEENRSLQSENDRMANDVARLSDDPRAIEHVARHELGWARPGDIVVEVSPVLDPAPAAAPPAATPPAAAPPAAAPPAAAPPTPAAAPSRGAAPSASGAPAL